MVLGRACSCSVRVGQRDRVGVSCLVIEQFFFLGRVFVLDKVDFEFLVELVVKDRQFDERVSVELVHVDRDLDFLVLFHSLLVTGSEQLVVVVNVNSLFDFSLVNVVEHDGDE